MQKQRENSVAGGGEKCNQDRNRTAFVDLQCV